MPTVLISLGSNLGDSRQLLQAAVVGIAQLGQVQTQSALYRTKPVGFTAQPDFLNAALQLDTQLASLELLHRLQALELAAGRQRLVHWGPRTLDLDMIAYGNVVQNSPELSLPHPRACERAFVLVPLNEIAPNFMLTPKLSVSAACRALSAAALAEVVKIGRIGN